MTEFNAQYVLLLGLAFSIVTFHHARTEPSKLAHADFFAGRQIELIVVPVEGA